VQTAAHVRTGPGTTDRVIGTLAQGATVEVSGWVSLDGGAIDYVWSKLVAPAVQPVAR
jgi:hypothetical protein